MFWAIAVLEGLLQVAWMEAVTERLQRDAVGARPGRAAEEADHRWRGVDDLVRLVDVAVLEIRAIGDDERRCLIG